MKEKRENSNGWLYSKGQEQLLKDRETDWDLFVKKKNFEHLCSWFIDGCMDAETREEFLIRLERITNVRLPEILKDYKEQLKGSNELL